VTLVDFKPFFDMRCKYVFVLGAERFSHDVEDMIGRPISRWWFFCWKFISPLSVLVSANANISG